MTSQQDGIKPEKTFRGLLGSGALVIFGDVDDVNDDEFNNWYTHQHLPERIGTPGFLRGRRFITAPGAERKPGMHYFTLYETESVETLASEPYMLRLNNPTDWTKKMVPLFRSRRMACRVEISIGAGMGGYAATIEFTPGEGEESLLREWLRSEAIPSSLEQRPSLLGMHLMQEDASTTKAKDQTTEGKSDSSAIRDLVTPWVLMVEGTSDSGVEGACRNLVSGLAAHGVNSNVDVSRYQLLASLS